MTTMGKLSGQYLAILFGGYDLSSWGSQLDFNQEYPELDFTSYQDGTQNSGPGIPDFTATATFFTDPDATFLALKTPGSHQTTAAYLSILIGEYATPTYGNEGLSVKTEQYQFTTPLAVREAVKANANFRSQGEKVYHGKVLAYATITNTLTGTAVDGAAAHAAGGTAILHVFDVVATDTYSIKVQHSTNGTDWVDYLTFTANGSTLTSEKQTSASSMNRYRRALATRTGSAGETLGLCVTLAEN
jgi:hypothetical protein